MISQSGALGGEFSRLAADLRLFMNKVISYGNGYVLDCTDYLEHFATDPATRYIGMYLEGVRDGEAPRMVQEIGPEAIVILKGPHRRRIARGRIPLAGARARPGTASSQSGHTLE
jgi:hypothetical protein